MSGKLIVIEGLDGSGKATQAGLLTEWLAGQGREVRKISFPNYDSDSSALVKMYLAGQFVDPMPLFETNISEMLLLGARTKVRD